MPEKRLPSLTALARSDDPLSDKQVLIQRLKLERPESRNLEWKLTLPFGPGATTRAKYRTVKTIIAYANTEGGFILFGIDPHGTWAGVPQADIEAFDPASLEELLSGCVSPAIRQMSYAHLETDGLHFGVLHIPPSPSMPHVTTKEIREDSQGKKPTVLLTRWGVYCRHGAKSDLATPEDFERVIARRTDRLKAELLRRVKEIEVPIARTTDADGLRVYRLSSDPKAPAVRVTRTVDDSTATLVREVLSGDLFSEINNVVNANSLLTEGRHQFSFAPEIYYRIYAERQHVETSVEHIELLARTALTRLNAPVLYWLVLLPPENAGRAVRALYDNPKSPHVTWLIRLAILLGPDVSAWLSQQWEQAWGKHSQPPDFYWTLKTVLRRSGVTDRRLHALRTTAAARIEDAQGSVGVKELLSSPDEASVRLSSSCHGVFQGRRTLRGACRDLDILAYGAEIERRGSDIGRALMKEDNG
jgi:hypothetical protein